MKLLRRFRDERGTMIPMYVLFVMIVIGLLTIVLDSTQVYLQRRALQGIADGASLAAADGIDIAALYEEGLGEGGKIELVRSQARTAVRRYQTLVNDAATQPHHRVDCVIGQVEGNRVQVICDRTAILPIVNYVSEAAGLGAEVNVQTTSWADANISQ